MRASVLSLVIRTLFITRQVLSTTNHNAYYVSNCSTAFQSSSSSPYKPKKIIPSACLPLFQRPVSLPSRRCPIHINDGLTNIGSLDRWRILAEPLNDGENITDDNGIESNTLDGRNGDCQQQSISTARAGGRSKRKIQNGTSSNRSLLATFLEQVKKLLLWVTVLPLIGFLLASILHIGTPSDGSYVYYESTVYETRSYTPDGELQRVRKESVKSNIPSLISGEKIIKDTNDENELSQKYTDDDMNIDFKKIF